ncbi:unnamed protein product [Diplocarpon coronariae]
MLLAGFILDPRQKPEPVNLNLDGQSDHASCDIDLDITFPAGGGWIITGPAGKEKEKGFGLRTRRATRAANSSKGIGSSHLAFSRCISAMPPATSRPPRRRSTSVALCSHSSTVRRTMYRVCSAYSALPRLRPFPHSQHPHHPHHPQSPSHQLHPLTTPRQSATMPHAPCPPLIPSSFRLAPLRESGSSLAGAPSRFQDPGVLCPASSQAETIPYWPTTVCRSISQSVNQSTSQPVNQSTRQPVNQSASQPVSQSIHQSSVHTLGFGSRILPYPTAREDSQLERLTGRIRCWCDAFVKGRRVRVPGSVAPWRSAAAFSQSPPHLLAFSPLKTLDVLRRCLNLQTREMTRIASRIHAPRRQLSKGATHSATRPVTRNKCLSFSFSFYQKYILGVQ